MHNDLAIIVVTYNSAKVILECLEALGECRQQTMVIDNNSTDGTVPMVRLRFPEVMVVENRSNIGFTRAIQQGTIAQREPWYVLLNPDALATPKAIDTLVGYLKANEAVAVVGPKTVYPDGRTQITARTFQTPQLLLLRWLEKVTDWQAPALKHHYGADQDRSRAVEVDWVLGSCMAIRGEALHAVGGFDEKYFLYYSDVDLCFRLKQKGWKTVYLPEVQIVHAYAQASVRAHLLSWLKWSHAKSAVRFFLKYYGVFSAG